MKKTVKTTITSQTRCQAAQSGPDQCPKAATVVLFDGGDPADRRYACDEHAKGQPRKLKVAKSESEYIQELLKAQGDLTHFAVLNPESGKVILSGALSDLAITEAGCAGCLLMTRGVLVLNRAKVRKGDVMLEVDRCPVCGKGA